MDGIDFDLFRGEAFGFLGPNAAGKSSTMRMLGCVSPPTLGELTILGGDPVRDGAAIRGKLGVVPQEDTLDNELTVRENLLVYGRFPPGENRSDPGPSADLRERRGGVPGARPPGRHGTVTEMVRRSTLEDVFLYLAGRTLID